MAWIKPTKQAKPKASHKQEESKLQQMCVAHYHQYMKLPYLLISIKNSAKLGGKTNKHGVPLEAIRAKAEGLTPGVADLMLLAGSFHIVDDTDYGALFIELKTATGRQSKEQKYFEAYCKRNSYKYVVCRSLEEFRKTIFEYLNIKK